ncbi:MAG: TonB-dependent receptor plug domain-containing protein [Bacteroidetes bacterium]|jgi:hypothetical protein|nr:TonB-dependent receptor plug domain-containing protein [Bacteroidota bacterium]
MEFSLGRKIIAMSKFFFYMAWLQCLFVTATFANNGNAQQLENTRISNNWEKEKLESAFADIQNQTDFFFTYDSKQIENLSVSSTIEELPLLEVLKFISAQTGLKFSVSDDLILVEYEKEDLTERSLTKQEISLPPLHELEQLNLNIIYKGSINKLEDERIVKGNVKSENGEPLIGATVRVKSTGQGTTTDVDGSFSLALPENGEATLTVSYIGYQTQEIKVNGQQNLTIILEENDSQLEEVIVVGYGVQKKRDVTTAVSSLGSEDIKDFAVAGFDQALVGKLAGVQVLQTTGEPGTAATIKIRGTKSITAGTQPLYVIDGVAMDRGSQAIE